MPPRKSPLDHKSLGPKVRLSNMSDRKRNMVCAKGSAKNIYVSRNKAIKYLDLSLPEFHRVCVNCNIFPRVPGNKFEGDTAYYLKSDMKTLQTSSYLAFIREQQTYRRKVLSLKQQKLYDELEMLHYKSPQFDYAQLVQQKYPTFEMALADLSDCLSTLALCSVMAFGHVKSAMVAVNKALLQDFKQYCIAVSALRKAFVTVKGCYLEAALSGAQIVWLEPFQTAFTVPEEAMATLFSNFCEFYQNLLKCINFRLYGTLGVEYQVGACQLRHQQSPAVAPQQLVFSGLRFFVSRECPRDWICSLIISGGGLVSEKPEDATHAVFDRITDKIPAVDVVVPQFVFDSFNCGFLLPASEYQCGKRPPPHLSPFQYRFDRLEVREGEYVPERLEQIVRYYDAFVRRTGGADIVVVQAPVVEVADGTTDQNTVAGQSGPIGATVKLPNADQEVSSEEEFRETDAKFSFIPQAQDLDLDDAERMLRGRMSARKREKYDEIIAQEKAALQERERLIRKRIALKKSERK